VEVQPPKKKYKLSHRKSSDGNGNSTFNFVIFTSNFENLYTEFLKNKNILLNRKQLKGRFHGGFTSVLRLGWKPLDQWEHSF
jgi:hypothetical protein